MAFLTLSGITAQGGLLFTDGPTSITRITTVGTSYFVVPSEITSLTVTVVGGGGSGAGGFAIVSGTSTSYRGGGGGAGGYIKTSTVSVVPKTVYTIFIGSGGAGGNGGFSGPVGTPVLPGLGSNGSASTFSLGSTVLISASGGYGGGLPSNDYRFGGGAFGSGEPAAFQGGSWLFPSPKTPPVPSQNGLSGGGIAGNADGGSAPANTGKGGDGGQPGPFGVSGDGENGASGIVIIAW